MLTRRHFLALSGASLLLPQYALAASGTETLGGPAFGTYWRLTLPSEATASVSRSRRINAIIGDIDKAFSPYRPDTEISVFNRTATSDWLPASAQFRVVLRHALDIAGQSGGVFDPTIGPLVSRYGFGPIKAEAWGGFAGIEVNAEAMRKGDAALSLDLCGIAKGHAIALLADDLEAHGIKDFLLDLGGELIARGHHPLGRDWQVGIEGLDGQLVAGVMLKGRAIATSGVAAQSYGPPDQLVSHIIDPLSGRPVDGATFSVSVLHANAALADGWATALMAMPFERALDMAKALDIDALVLIGQDGALRAEMTGNFASHVLG